ncbi:hypothetical protein ACFW2V_12820 [Streptomyces sp. NPDC058947]|uniref:hypothetical protein n=1 Tax=Streptomyces sp. NPDC058947 TaxID=3346675 RepID=UPI00369C68C7
MRATNLTTEQITELRERARREAGPFTNPAITSSSYSHNPEWAAEIIGERSNPRVLTWLEVYLLYIAKQAEPDPPPLAMARRRAYEQEEKQRRAAEQERWRQEWSDWEYLKATLEAAGTQVTVRHNYTSHRHLDGYTQGADHIYLKKPLTFGRLRRDADIVLCWTPSRAKDLEYFPVEGEYDDRVPTCKACIKTARSIAERIKKKESS